jgi:alkanesulfonate monooxygenase SsuD/methylene tetrahydromethanopterin reductase-like flavin-dependent oxidoreductase (luciferase family)
VKFGIFFIGDNYPVERSNADFYVELLDQVAYAEELGLHSVWFAEHHHVGESAAQIREVAEKYIIRYFRTVPIPPLPEGTPLTDLTRKYEELRQWNQTVTYEQLLEQNVVLFGDPARCREKIRVIQDAGITTVLRFMNFGGLAHEQVRASMRLFVEEVMPHFHS